VDWVHSLSKAPMLKAQHPDFELYQTGVHAQRGVSCADCHMPYRTEGGVKFTDHWLQSPLNNISNACAVCHRESEETLRNDVYKRQDTIFELRRIAEPLLARAHIEAKAAWDAGATEPEMKEILRLIRHSQWRWDFVVASVALGAHSPLESARIMSTSIEKVSEARRQLAVLLLTKGVRDVPMPDISTKEKAQAYIGLDMPKLREQKEAFLRDVVPQWIQSAAERESKMQPEAKVPVAGQQGFKGPR